MPDLTIVVPSKGRSTAVGEFMESMEKTCRADTKVLWALDEDDPHYVLYRSEINSEDVFSIPAWIPMVPKLNLAAFATESFAVGFMGDDHRPRTVGWDEKYLQALNTAGIHMVFGDDLVWGGSLPTQIAMTSKLIHTLGFMVPVEINHLWCDNFWKTLGDNARIIKYLPDVIVEHMHHIVGKAEHDATYSLSEGYMEADREAYENFIKSIEYTELLDKVKRLRDENL